MSQEEERSVHRVVVASKYGSTREVAGELGQGEVSVALVGLTFHPWPLGAVAIDVAVAVVALT